MNLDKNKTQSINAIYHGLTTANLDQSTLSIRDSSGAPMAHSQAKTNPAAQPPEENVQALEAQATEKEAALKQLMDEFSLTAFTSKIDFKEPLADCFRQSHRLMTLYNRMLHSLVNLRQLTNKQVQLLAAQMIREVMPPLDEIKQIEKSLTAAKQKEPDLTIAELKSRAQNHITELETALVRIKAAIYGITAPQQQESEPSQAAEQIDQLATPETEPHQFRIPRLHQLHEQWREHTVPAKTMCSRLIRLCERERETYQNLRGLFVSVLLKCEVCSKQLDKVCAAALTALDYIEENDLTQQPINSALFIELDNQLWALKKIERNFPNEVKQLMTELSVKTNAQWLHLINLLCRAHWPAENRFVDNKNVQQFFNKLPAVFEATQQNEKAFTTQLKPLIIKPDQLQSYINKSDELVALIHWIAKRKKMKKARLRELLTLSQQKGNKWRQGIDALFQH